VKLLIFLAVSFFFSAAALRADWRWENDLSVATATGEDYRVTFKFENHGTTPVTVTDLHFSCPCTVYHFNATTAQPGKIGKLVIDVKRESVETLDQELLVIAEGSGSASTRELTIRLPKGAGSR